LRRRKAAGWHFRRQQVIEGFIVDFFCAKLRLVVEIDGEVHGRPDVAEYDRWRDEVLVARGLKVVRVLNHELSEELIAALVRQRQGEIAESPPPPRGGGGRGEGL
jgi:very-short-patch-repair endonuclease